MPSTTPPDKLTRRHHALLRRGAPRPRLPAIRRCNHPHAAPGHRPSPPCHAVPSWGQPHLPPFTQALRM